MCPNKVLCILCLRAADQFINLFKDDGSKLNVCGIISKHFWIQPKEEGLSVKVVCLDCWNTLYEFHKFYETIEAAHRNLQDSNPSADKELKEESDSDADSFHPCADFISAVSDIKAESIESDPSIEVEVKVDPSDALVDSDSDSEVPLATLAKRGKSESITNLTACSDKQDPPSKLSLSSDSECLTKKKKVKLKNTRKKITKESKKCNRGEEVRIKRRNVDPAKIKEQSREYDEIIEKNMKLFCSICHLPLSNFLLLRKHYHSIHKERGYATCCGRKFRKRGILVDHIHLHLNPEYFKCEKCNRIMADRRSLEMHMTTHDTNKERIYQCEKCTKSFFRKFLLDRHMYTHIPDRDFNCEYCQKLFSSKYTLQQHKTNVHNPAYKKICEQCGKSFRGLESFRRHQLEHSGMPIPLVECEKCGVKLTTKYGLKRHMNSIHPEIEVLHICNVCGKESPSEAALQRHISYMHKCERIHKCPMCDKAFKRPRVLLPSAENANDKVICVSCWQALNSFHKFYQKVEEAHSNLISTWSAATLEPKDILSAAIQSAGIIQDSDDEPDSMDALSSDDDDSIEDFDRELTVRRMPTTELDQIISQHMKLTCNICAEPMRNFFLLKRHFESVHHENGYVICCKLKFKRQCSLADHLYFDHNLVCLCDKCGQIMADCGALNAHKAAHTNCASQVNMTSAVTVRIEKTIQTSTVTSCTTKQN